MKRGLPVAVFTVGAIYFPVIGSDAERPLIVLEKISKTHYREYNVPDSKPFSIPSDEHGIEVVTYVFSELYEDWLFVPVLGGRVVVDLTTLCRKEEGQPVLVDQPDSEEQFIGFEPSMTVVSLGIAVVSIVEKDGKRYPMITVDRQW